MRQTGLRPAAATDRPTGEWRKTDGALQPALQASWAATRSLQDEGELPDCARPCRFQKPTSKSRGTRSGGGSASLPICTAVEKIRRTTGLRRCGLESFAAQQTCARATGSRQRHRERRPRRPESRPRLYPVWRRDPFAAQAKQDCQRTIQLSRRSSARAQVQQVFTDGIAKNGRSGLIAGGDHAPTGASSGLQVGWGTGLQVSRRFFHNPPRLLHAANWRAQVSRKSPQAPQLRGARDIWSVESSCGSFIPWRNRR